MKRMNEGSVWRMDKQLNEEEEEEEACSESEKDEENW